MLFDGGDAGTTGRSIRAFAGGGEGGLVGPSVIYRWRENGPALEGRLAHLGWAHDGSGLVEGVKCWKGTEGGTPLLCYISETDELCAFALVGPSDVSLYGVFFFSISTGEGKAIVSADQIKTFLYVPKQIQAHIYIRIFLRQCFN